MNTQIVRTRRSVDIDIGAGPVLRVTVEEDQAGVAETLHIGIGWRTGENWQQLSRHDELRLPALVIPELRAALNELIGGT